MTTHVANISYLTDIRFGAGALQCLPDVMDTLSMTRPLVVTDAVLRDLGFVDRLGIDSAAVFDGVPTNPTEASVMQGVALFRSLAVPFHRLRFILCHASAIPIRNTKIKLSTGEPLRGG